MKKTTMKFFAVMVFALIGTLVMGQTQYNITFQVDMTDADPFDPVTDEVFLSGTLAGWTMPGDSAAFKMEPLTVGSMLYVLTYAVDSGWVSYKYFRVIDGAASWDNGEWNGDPNRTEYLKEDKTLENVWANKPFNVTFNVNMTDADPFNPETDDVYMSGSLFGWPEPGTFPDAMMTATEGDPMIYTKTVLLYKGDYLYKYFRVIEGAPSWGNGEWEGDPNRTFAVDTAEMTIDDVWAVFDAGIFDPITPFSYKMYPNPVGSVLYITDIRDVNRIEIYDITSKLVRFVDLNSAEQTSIDVSELQTGVYIVHIFNEKGVQSTKFLKE